MTNGLIENALGFACTSFQPPIALRDHPSAMRQRKRTSKGAGIKIASFESTIPAKVLTGYRELVAALGGDPIAMLKSAGIDPEIVARPNGRIRFHEFALLLEYSSAVLKCPDFGMKLSDFQDGNMLMSPLRTLFESVPTLEDVLNYSKTFMYIYCSDIHLHLERFSEYGQPLLRLEVISDKVPYRRQVTEQMVALAYSGSVLSTGGRAQPKEIWFSHEPLAGLGTYRKRFKSDVRFSQPFNAIFFSDEGITSTIISNRPSVVEGELSALSKQFPYRSQFYRDVKGIVNRTVMEMDCTRAAIAAALRIHPRTLHRRLREEGMTFESLKDEVRRDLAMHFLAQSNVSLLDVAARLGYAELSVFSRACKRWFGAPPSRVRQSLVAQDPSLDKRTS